MSLSDSIAEDPRGTVAHTPVGMDGVATIRYQPKPTRDELAHTVV